MTPQSNLSAGSHGLFFLGLVPPGPDIVYIATLVYDDMTNWKENALICVKYYYATSFSTFSFFAKLSTILPNY